MNDEQIVLSLLNFYRNEGIDLHQILDDPIFNSLSLPTKISAIKRHAQLIHDGMSSGINRHELKGIGKSLLWHGIMGGMTGAAATATTAKLFAGGRTTPMAIALGAATGAGSGLGLAAIRQFEARSERNELRKYLREAAERSDEESALHTIAKRNLQNSQRSENNVAFNKFIDRIVQHNDERARDAAIRETVRFNTAAGRKMTGQSN